MQAYGYIRVSGAGQMEGSGLERQRETIREWAGRNGYEIVREFEDCWTGVADTLDRPGFVEMVGGMNGVRVIVVERLDRLARSVVVQEQSVTWLAAHGIELIVADTGENVTEAYRADPMKKALVQMQAVFAELEKGMIVKKLRLARERIKREKGKCEGRKAYGEENREERRGVVRIRELRRNGMGNKEIATVMDTEGWKTMKGGKWNRSSVRSIVAGRVYANLA